MGRLPDRVVLPADDARRGALLLQVVLIAAKLAFGLGWSWWLVLCPMWVPVLLAAEVMLGMLLADIAAVLTKRRRQHR